MTQKEEKKTRVKKPKHIEKPLSESEFFDALTEVMKRKGKTIEKAE